MKNLKNIKEAFLNGKHGINRKGQRVIYIGYELEKVNDSYPYAILIVPDSIKDAEIEWVTENLRYHTDTDSDYDIVDLWEDKPEPFNLERALAGEPVLLRNGLKAEVLKALDKPDTRGFQYFGLSHQTSADGIWYHEQGWNAKLKGSRLKDGSENNYDIIGMWKEPEPVQPSADDLPKPIKDFGDLTEVWYIELNDGADVYKPNSSFKGNFWNVYQQNRLKSGCYYASKKDCQKICNWLMNR